MQASLGEQTTGCIGICKSGLTREELDKVTDNIENTLAHPKGREIFRDYLQQRRIRDNQRCLELYETCCDVIERDRRAVQSRREPSVDSLKAGVETVQEMARRMQTVPQIDSALLRRFNAALEGDSRNELLAVLEETKRRASEFLKLIHRRFKRDASQPCPLGQAR